MMLIPQMVKKAAITAVQVTGSSLKSYWPYLALLALVLSFAAGYHVKARFAKAEIVDAVQAAREQEHRATQLAVEAERSARRAAELRERKANDSIQALKKRIENSPRCDLPVPAEWLRNPVAMPDASRATASAGSRAAGVDTDQPAGVRLNPPDEPVADARAAIVACERNRTGPFAAEVEERKQLREFYKALVKQYNGRL